MKDIFVATSFSAQVDYETGLVLPEFRAEMEENLASLRTAGGFAVFCAMEYEGWKLGDEPPEVGVEKDMEEIEKREGFVAILQPTISEGVQDELGYARRAGKKVIIARKPEIKLGWWNTGIVNLGLAEDVVYETAEELGHKVASAFDK